MDNKILRITRIKPLIARINMFYHLEKVMAQIILKEESYQIIGICMEVHTELGMGFREAVLQRSFRNGVINHNITYEREKVFRIEYKGKF